MTEKSALDSFLESDNGRHARESNPMWAYLRSG